MLHNQEVEGEEPNVTAQWDGGGLDINSRGERTFQDELT
jgi:hypothetical protein